MVDAPSRILIVDDEEPILDFLSEYFSSIGFTVHTASLGAEALESSRAHAFDVILVDLNLPDMSGLDILHCVSSEDDEVALIVISGGISMEGVIEALRRGAWDYLVKPFPDLQIVEHAVNSALERVRLKRENRQYREHLEEAVCIRTAELYQEIQLRKQVEAELRRSELRYRELSLTDELTGLFNARHFFRQMQAECERALRYSHPLALCVMDVDNFKIYNDTYGHLSGDAVLSELGRIIQRLIRDADSAYRYGGEEFILLLPETQPDEAVRVAERIRTVFNEHAFFPKNGTEVHVTLSLGVTRFKCGAESPSNFLERADRNMYTAKKNGRNRTFCR